MKVTITAKAGPQALRSGAKESGLGGDALKAFTKDSKTINLVYNVDGDGESKLCEADGKPLLDVNLR